MRNKPFNILLLIAVLSAAVFFWWRGRPLNRVRRVLERAAAVATVTLEDNEIMRRMKASRLRDYAGYEILVDVEGIVRDATLTQEEAITGWSYAVGIDRFLLVDFQDIELIDADDERIIINATIVVDSNYDGGRYSDSYPVLIELMNVERRLLVSALKTRL